MTLGKKILLSKIILVAVPVALVAGVALWQSRVGFGRALGTSTTAFEKSSAHGREALIESGMTDLTHQAEIIYAMCAAQQEVLQQKVTYDLNVARAVLKQTGAVTFSEDTTTWDAINQYSQAKTQLDLPKLRVGDAVVERNADPSVPSPIVDEVRDLVGGTCTIFQRMNAAGDMLRVCTNVLNKDGQRAIGTFIPATNADASANPVVSTILRGQTYEGRAFVVDGWYITAYEPIKDAANEIVGMLYVGVPQESAKSLRTAIMNIKVGKTGYVYVLNGKGQTAGHYVISYQGKRDGEDISQARDADGRLFIQDICAAATELSPGEIGEIRYPWKNAGDATAREKIVKLAYFEPWDWVIGVGAYLEEFHGAADQMQALAATAITDMQAAGESSRAMVASWCAGIGAVAIFMAIFVALVVTASITRPVNRIIQNLNAGAEQVHDAAGQVSSTAQQLAEGASEQASSLEETSSALEQAAAMTRRNAENAENANRLSVDARNAAENANQTTSELNDAMTGINESAGKISKIIKVIEEIAFQTNLLALNAAVEAARAGEHGKGFAVVAEEVRNLAKRAASAAGETTQLIEDAVNRARDGAAVSQNVAGALGSINEAVSQVSSLIAEIAKASGEQSNGIEQINTALNQMNQITQSNAAGAEESASASEELSAQATSLRAEVESLARLVGVRQNTRVAESALDPTAL